MFGKPLLADCQWSADVLISVGDHPKIEFWQLSAFIVFFADQTSKNLRLTHKTEIHDQAA